MRRKKDKKSKKKFLFILLAIFFFLVNNKSSLEELIIKEVFPSFKSENKSSTFYKYQNKDNTLHVNKADDEKIMSKEKYKETLVYGKDDVKFLPDSDIRSSNSVSTKENLVKSDLANLDFENFKRRFFIIDKITDLREADFPINDYLNMDFSIENSSDPKVLIYHTHSNELYADSDGDLEKGIFAVGNELKKQLKEKHGIEAIHSKERFDLLNGSATITGAYSRAEEGVKKILEQYPSIEVVIDVHRDAVAESTRLVEEINSKSTAKIMFVNGLSQVLEAGDVQTISYLPNDNRNNSLAFSFQLQLLANEIYPNLTRKIYLHAHRYNLHLSARSLLIEVGAQNNTIAEAKNAMLPFADTLAKILLEK